MKKLLLLISVVAIALQSCNFSYRGRPEQLAIPVLKALQNNDVQAAICLLPTRQDIVEVTYSNPGIMGYQFYNKYSETYNYENLIGKITSAVDICRKISLANSLDWQNAMIGSVKTEEITQEDAGYTKCFVDVKFPNGKKYQVIYNAVKTNNRGWYLADDIYFKVAK